MVLYKSGLNTQILLKEFFNDSGLWLQLINRPFRWYLTVSKYIDLLR